MMSSHRFRWSRLKNFFDPFLFTLVAILIFGVLVPVPGIVISVLSKLSLTAVIFLFFLYGLRLPTKDIWDGLRNFRLQGSILGATFVLFPLLGSLFYLIFSPVLGNSFAAGLLYLCLLPSTVQSSVAFTSIARGNTAGAVCAATISNIFGMVATPALVTVIMGRASGVNGSSIVNVLTTLLIPFILGQLLQPWLGKKVKNLPTLTKATDRGTILLVVASGVFGAAAKGLWGQVTWLGVAQLVGVCTLLLGLMLALTWLTGKLIGLDRADKIALLMCGSKKSLATGLPMAAIIFPATGAAAVSVPVIVFHQLQLMVCTALARRLARRA